MTREAQEPPLDALDRTVLRRLRAAWSILDRPPGDLDARVAFAIDLADTDIEVAHTIDALAGARAAGPSRTVAFDSRGLSIMVVITEEAVGLRIDGWCAPPGRRRIELRTGSPGPDGRRHPYTVDSDGSGRFALLGVPHGLAQLLLRGTGRSRRRVVTPSIVL
jgi:hypothetical protein